MWCRWSLRVDVLCQSVAVFKAILYTVSKKKRCHWFFCCDVYKYWRIFIIFLCTTSQENDKVIGIKIYHHTFVMLLPYRVKVSDTKVTHFTTILALCTCLYRLRLRKPVSMKQTKHSRKSEAQNLCSKCPPFTRTHAYATVQSLMVSVTVSSLGAKQLHFLEPGLRSTVNITGIQFC